MLQKILFVLFIIFLALLELSFISSLPAPFAKLNLVLSVTIFIGLFLDYSAGLFIAFISGVILDMFAPFGFGAITFSQVATLAITHFIFDNFFTNRSLYSLLVLSIVGTFIYSLIRGFLALFHVTGFLSIEFFKNILEQAVLNTIFLLILFSAVNFFSKRFKSVFLSTR